MFAFRSIHRLAISAGLLSATLFGACTSSGDGIGQGEGGSGAGGQSSDQGGGAGGDAGAAGGNTGSSDMGGNNSMGGSGGNSAGGNGGAAMGGSGGASAMGGNAMGGNAMGGNAMGGNAMGGNAMGGNAMGGAGGMPTACGNGSATNERIPLNDLGANRYLGMFSGGLYPGCSNQPPSSHAAAAAAAARSIQPLDLNGNPSANGKYVLVSIGMSNTTMEFCHYGQRLLAPNCLAHTFAGQAWRDAVVNKTTLVIANGARGSQVASTWDMPTDVNYQEVVDQVLAPNGLSERQVQIAWVKVANPGPTVSLPSNSADAYRLVAQIGGIMRSLKVRYPNIKLAFLSSRIYALPNASNLNPEPYAYQSGFAVKWAIEAQINQIATGTADARAGNLDYRQGGPAPVMLWGAYLWANGSQPRSDGLTWETADLDPNDGVHPSMSGQRKVGTQLLDFFKSSPAARCWFTNGGTCP